jgi:hypothetical protein
LIQLVVRIGKQILFDPTGIAGQPYFVFRKRRETTPLGKCVWSQQVKLVDGHFATLNHFERRGQIGSTATVGGKSGWVTRSNYRKAREVEKIAAAVFGRQSRRWVFMAATGRMSCLVAGAFY